MGNTYTQNQRQPSAGQRQEQGAWNQRVFYSQIQGEVCLSQAVRITKILSRVKQITSPGWMHETSARTWCTGETQRDRVEREVGGGTGMGNTCISMADSCQCMTKTTAIL